MTTERQIEANRRNARKSAGPTTLEGKAIAKMNALRHGLTAREILIPGERREQFDELLERLAEEIEPNGAIETKLVEQIATNLWRLRRARQIEAGIFAHNLYEIDYQMAAAEYEDLNFPRLYGAKIKDQKRYDDIKDRAKKIKKLQYQDLAKLGKTYMNDIKTFDALGKLSRYEAGFERSLYRALHELQRLQAARKSGVASPPVAIDVSVDVSPLGPSDGD